jgi:hypothetical protein
MKIYISGKITGLPKDEVLAKFEDAEILLDTLGLKPVNPMKNGLSYDDCWEKHLVRDVEILLRCDAIYLFDNWIDSKGARIEKNIADELGMDILFESNVVQNQTTVLRIQNAIHEVTGMRFHEYITKSRKRDGFFARMMFVYHCRQSKMKLTDIARYVHRDHTSMIHFLKKYDDEVRYNPYFRVLAQRVDGILNKTSDAKA